MNKKSTESEPARWSELPIDLLVRVFINVEILDLVAGVSRTCKTWRTACFDPCLWKKVDLSSVKKSDLVTNLPNPYSWSDESSSWLMLILNIALNFSRGNMTCLIFPFYLHIESKKYLISVAQRSPKLKRLVLPAWFQLNVKAFRKAVKYWKNLESLSIPYAFCYDEIMSSIGEYCKNLSELKFFDSINMNSAEAIVKYVPKLKVLSLRYTMPFKGALLHLLKHLKDLEVLNLTHSDVVDFIPGDGGYSLEFSARGVKEITEHASRLKKFLTCTERDCAKCNRSTTEDENCDSSFEFAGEEWLWDEVPSLAI